MATQIAREEARFRRIYARQWLDRWYDKYDAGIHATGREAPFASGATILAPQKMGRRPFHCLSTGETWAALLLIFHPGVWEVHEQRILYPVPRKHFLEGHPRGAGFRWPQFRGTLDVAERSILCRIFDQSASGVIRRVNTHQSLSSGWAINSSSSRTKRALTS